MAELATIARPYAEALFKASGSDLSSVLNWLDEMAAVAGNSQLLQYAADPKTTNAQVFDVVCGVVKVDLNTAAKNFLEAVVQNGRLSALPEIAAQFRALANARGGSSDAKVYSAFPVEGDALQDMTQALEKRFGRKLNVTLFLDSALIGGVRVVVGDEVLDTSVRARLEQMKVALTA